jgi:hypothetical protein
MRWLAISIVLAALIVAGTAIWIEQHPHHDACPSNNPYCS